MSEDAGEPSLADIFYRMGSDSSFPPGEAADERVKIMKEKMAALIPSKINTILPEGVYAVGGSVRDLVMGREPHDVDLTTPVRPEEVMARCRAAGIRVIETGLRHGTVTAIIDGEAYEITTFRTDVLTDGRHAVVEYTDSLEQDLIRRDFTMNAMAIDPEGNLIDPFGGQEDIRRRRVETVGNPFHRFEEDYLRILRGVRFAAVLGFEIEPETLAAMEVMAPDLCRRISRGMDQYRRSESLSVERVVEEFNKAFNSKYPSIFLRTMWGLGVVQTMVPEMEDADLLMQDPRWHPEGSVWNHIVDSVDRSSPDHRWHALLHDIGKCLVAEQTPEGHYRFEGHDVAGSGVIDDIGRRLRFPQPLIESIEKTTDLHMQPLNSGSSGPSERAVRRFQHRAGPHLYDVEQTVRADAGERYDDSWDVFWSPRTEQNDVAPILMGRHLIERGMSPGPQMGDTLRRALEHQLDTGETDIDRLFEIAANRNVDQNTTSP